MAMTSRISEAEWRVMEVLWEKSPMASADVIEALAKDIDWHPKTVRTLLSRLVAKRCLSTRTEGGRYLYTPRVRRDTCVRAESRSFLSRVFAGDAAALLTHFVDRGNLSQQQIDELRTLLNGKEKSK